jgi:hypothetical protein
LEEIARLQARLPPEAGGRNDYILNRYLEEMTTYTECAIDSIGGGGDSDSEYLRSDTHLEAPQPPAENHRGSTYPESPSQSSQTAPSPTSPPRGPSNPNFDLVRRVSPSPKTMPNHIILFRGPLVLDIPVPKVILHKVPHGERDEFTHVRYTTVTCEPDHFAAKEEYALRQSLFAKPRRTAMLLSVYLSKPSALPTVLEMVWTAFDALGRVPSKTGEEIFSPFGAEAWKRRVFHLHCPYYPRDEVETYLHDLGARPVRLDRGVKSSTELEDNMEPFSEVHSVNGHEVLHQIYEVSFMVILLK